MAIQSFPTDDHAPRLAYSTDVEQAWVGDAAEVLQTQQEDESVDLIITSPPFALQRPKEYGNETQDSYKEWFLPFADEFWRVLKPTGSLVLDLGGAWEAGQPVKSLYAFELLVSLCRRPSRSFVLAQDLYWYNPARLPSPAQWVTVDRVRQPAAVRMMPMVAGEKVPLGSLPVPSTSFTSDVTFEHPGGSAILRFEFRRDGGPSAGGIRFERVRAYRFRAETHCTAWHVEGVYDTWSWLPEKRLE